MKGLIITLIGASILAFAIYSNTITHTITSSEGEYSVVDEDADAFELDSMNKYIITTDFKWLTMRNDGGSNTSIYYQIDLDNNTIRKVQEDYKANLAGTPSTTKGVVYAKKIDAQIQLKVKNVLDEVIAKEDINDTHNYECFTVEYFDGEKSIYNENTIKEIKSLLKEIDEL